MAAVHQRYPDVEVHAEAHTVRHPMNAEQTKRGQDEERAQPGFPGDRLAQHQPVDAGIEDHRPGNREPGDPPARRMPDKRRQPGEQTEPTHQQAGDPTGDRGVVADHEPLRIHSDHHCSRTVAAAEADAHRGKYAAVDQHGGQGVVTDHAHNLYRNVKPDKAFGHDPPCTGLGRYQSVP
ncbi:MAG: hypothetical protein ACRDQ5_08415 [Sciscionella sp.]